MPDSVSAQYYQNRMRSAVAMSRVAAEPAIGRIHLDMARRYADLAGEAQTIEDYKSLNLAGVALMIGGFYV